LGISEHISASADRATGRNALWQYFGLTQRAEIPARSDDPTGAKMDLILEEIRRLRIVGREALQEDTEVVDGTPKGDFNKIALASPKNPGGQSLAQYPAKYRNLLQDLAVLADSVNGLIRVVRITDKNIAIDTGPYTFFAVENKMRDRAAKDGIEISGELSRGLGYLRGSKSSG